MLATMKNRWDVLKWYRRVGMECHSLEEYRRFIFDGCDQRFKPLQVASEIDRLLEIVHRHRPRRLLEIGTANGGTLFLFARASRPDAQLISLDLPYGQYGGGYSPIRIPLYRRFARDNQQVCLIRDDSHKPANVRVVRALLGGEPLDFLFIDGDHSYEGVKTDFEQYAPLVRKGGIIAFHDIARHPEGDDCHVDRFWEEIRGRYEHEEIIEHPEQGWGGIGVLYL